VKFPPLFAGKWARSKLEPGAVLYLQVRFTQPPVTKDKFFLVTGTGEDEVRGFLINSETSNFIASRPDLAKCQVTIDQAGHVFLTQDSQVACHEIWRFGIDEVVADIARDGARFKGSISTAVAGQVVSAAKFASTLSSIECAEVIDNLEQFVSSAVLPSDGIAS
jgi:hypothetical protein